MATGRAVDKNSFASIRMNYYEFQVEDAGANKLSEADKKLVIDKCSAVLAWLDKNTLAEKDEYEDKLKDLQKDCGPIMVKLHQGPVGANKGPTVEEVD